MPRFSIILPTYNRRDTIMRAVNSALAQTFGDFELLITDDGSTDGTAELLEGLDPRISLRRQPNGGLAAARNAGMSRSKGEYIAFLDSDDEWLPHHLELTDAFFRAHPDEHVFSGEFWVDYSRGDYVKHFRASMDWYVPVARRIGLGGLALPPAEDDAYLRFYSQRTEVGDWGRAIVEKLPYEGVRYYSGHIFEHFRWGYLLAAQSTVISRTAFERIGLLDPSYPNGCDFGFLALACKYYRAHMVSAPACIKHEFAGKGAELAEGHVSTGSTAMQYAKDLLRWHEVLFWNERQTDPELSALRACAQLYVARLALERGLVSEAEGYLASAVTAYPGPEARLLLTATKTLPPRGARAFARSLYEVEAQYSRVTRRAKDAVARARGASAATKDATPLKPPSQEELAGVRPYLPSELPELMRLRGAIHGERSIFADPTYFDWIYSQRQQLLGKPSQLWIHRSKSGIDGQVGVVPVDLKIGDDQAKAGWLFDLAVDVSTRGRGTAGALSTVASESAQAVMALEVSGGGRRVLLRAGWSDLGSLPLYVRPVDARVMARRIADRIPGVGAMGNGLLAGVSALGQASATLMGLEVEPIREFDERVDRVWQEASKSYPVAVRRDSRTLNWRFARFPHAGRYRLLYATRKKTPVAYLVLRIGEHHGAPAGYIVDYFCQPRWMLGVLALAVEELQREAIAAIYCVHLNPVTVAPLLALGFIPRKSGWPFVADLQRLSPASAKLASDPRNWFITAGDGDVDRPVEGQGLETRVDPGARPAVA